MHSSVIFSQREAQRRDSIWPATWCSKVRYKHRCSWLLISSLVHRCTQLHQFVAREVTGHILHACLTISLSGLLLPQPVELCGTAGPLPRMLQMKVHHLLCLQFPDCLGHSGMPQDNSCHWSACHYGLHSLCVLLEFSVASGIREVTELWGHKLCAPFGSVRLCLNLQQNKTNGIHGERSQDFFWGGAHVYPMLPYKASTLERRRHYQWGKVAEIMDQWWETFILAYLKHRPF